MTDQTINLETLKNTVLIQITRKGWGNRAKVRDLVKLQAYLEIFNRTKKEGSVPLVDAVGIEEAKDKKRKKNGKRKLSASVKLIECDALSMLLEHMTETKRLALQYAMPSFVRPGSFVMQRTYIETVQALLEKREVELREYYTDPDGNRQDGYLPAFLKAYPDAIETAKGMPVCDGGLGPLFNESDFPDVFELEKRFSVSWNWFGLVVPEGLPPELRAKEERKLRSTFEEAAVEIKDALRLMFAKLIERAVDRLQPAVPGEKPKVFRDTLIGNINEFFATFEARNIMGDAELAALVAKAKEVLTGVDPGRLRLDTDLKAKTEVALTQIATALEPMVREAEERAFDFSE